MVTFPVLYSDIGKKARDVLYKDYARQPPTYFHYQNVQWHIDLSCETKEILPGLTTLFRFTIPDSCKVELRFLQDYFGIAGGVGVKAHKQGPFNGNEYNPLVHLSSVAGSNFFSAGAAISYDIATSTFDQISAGLSFNNEIFSTSLTMADKFDTLNASCCHEFNPPTETAIAAELEHKFSLNGATTLTIGAQHALFPFMLMKTRMNSDAKLGALIRIELWQKLLLALDGEVDLRNEGKISKVGLSMALLP